MIICKLKNNTDENHICFCFCTNLYLHMYILNVHWAFFKACNSKMKNNVISDSTVSISVNKSYVKLYQNVKIGSHILIIDT